MRFLKLSIILFITLTTFSQISEITQIDESLKYENFYSYSTFFGRSDTLFSFLIYREVYTQHAENIISYSKSSDYGITWSDVKNISTSFTTEISNDRNHGNEVIQLSDGSFLCAVKTKEMNLMILKSDNLSVFDSVFVISQSRNPEFTELSDGTVLLTYHTNVFNKLSLRSSDDNGLNWSKSIEISPNNFSISKSITQQFENDHLITSYLSDQNKIVILESFDKGLTWENERVVLSGDENLKNPYLSNYIDGTILLIFQKTLTTPLFNREQEELFFIKSTDMGISWSEPEKFTHFIGNDNILDISNSSYGPLLTFASNRVYSNINTIHFGIVDVSTDPAPPVTYDLDYEDFALGSDNIITMKAEDDGYIENVFLKVNNFEYPLYDDGQHYDNAAGDNIFGNLITGFDNRSLTTTSFIEANNIYLPFNNKGLIAELGIDVQINGFAVDNDNNEASYNVTSRANNSFGGSYLGQYFLFSGGFYLSGYSINGLWANGVSAVNRDYLPGNVGSNPDDTKNIIYSVFEDDIPFGNAWQKWSDAVDQGAYFYDGDYDGIYNPVDKNKNGKWDSNEDKPDLLYDATYFTVFNDGRPAVERAFDFDTVDPVGIEIRQTIFASSQNSVLDDVVFVRYSILYKGLNLPDESDELPSVIFSFWNWVWWDYETKVACDTTLNAGFFYRDKQQVSEPLPALFSAIVQGPRIETRNTDDIAFNRMGPGLGEEKFEGYRNGKLGSHTISNDDFNIIGLNHPGNKTQARNLSMGLPYDGTPLDPCEAWVGELFGGVNCESVNPIFQMSGDPVTNYGWLMPFGTLLNNYVNTEKFTLVKDQPMDIIVAYVMGQGTDGLNSITKAREITQYVHEEYERNFSTLVGVEDEPEEVVNRFSLSQNYPNPFNPSTTIKFTIAGTPPHPSPYQGEGASLPAAMEGEGLVSLVVYNILGQKVKTLVNEVKAPGSYEVTFDASQLASGVYFYRLTSGSFMQTKKMILLR